MPESEVYTVPTINSNCIRVQCGMIDLLRPVSGRIVKGVRLLFQPCSSSMLALLSLPVQLYRCCLFLLLFSLCSCSMLAPSSSIVYAIQVLRWYFFSFLLFFVVVAVVAVRVSKAPAADEGGFYCFRGTFTESDWYIDPGGNLRPSSLFHVALNGLRTG